jgi:hypothetical protein
MPSWFENQGLGASGYGGGYNGSGITAGLDLNPAGAAADPFAYTGGSLLTPWTEEFSYSGPSGGYTPPEVAAFQFGQAGVGNIPRLEAMQLQARPDFDFKFSQDDPSYQFRLKEGQRALENSAAARGTLLSGATAKALQNYGQEAASQEYGNAFGRALQGYQTNLGKDFGTFDRNWGAKLGAGTANINAALGEGQLQLGVWDRNMGLARTQWQDAKSAAEAAAAASASNGARSYSQALNEYNMRRGNFFENQDRQYSRLMGGAALGQYGAGLAAGAGSSYGGNVGSIYGQAGNAAAAGTVGAANAWNQALGGFGNAAMNYAMYNAYGNGGQE